MATNDQIKTALLTEHFRYTPLTLLDDIINTVNELVYQAVGEIETALLNVPKEQLGFAAAGPPHDNTDASEEASSTEIGAGIVKLQTLLDSTIDKNFDKLEIYTLRNLLTVSNAKEDEGLESWIVLDHYKDLQTPAEDGNATTTAPTPDSITRLRRRVQETEKLQSALQAEATQNEALLAQLRSLVSAPPATASSKLDTNAPQPSFSFLTTTPSATALGVGSTSHANSLVQNTSFISSQLPAVREIVATLRSHLSTLPEKNMANTIDGATEARQAYIETQTKRALERVGVDAVAAPDTEVLGRRMGGEETRALEDIVAGMSAQQKKDGVRMEE